MTKVPEGGVPIGTQKRRKRGGSPPKSWERSVLSGSASEARPDEGCDFSISLTKRGRVVRFLVRARFRIADAGSAVFSACRWFLQAFVEQRLWFWRLVGLYRRVFPSSLWTCVQRFLGR